MKIYARTGFHLSTTAILLFVPEIPVKSGEAQ
jgi:hypothetical protein